MFVLLIDWHKEKWRFMNNNNSNNNATIQSNAYYSS